MNDYDIVIAGGGPIGCYIAEQLARNGIQVAIFEEHKMIGEPLHCAGLVTPRIFDIINFSQMNLVQNKIYGAHIHSPDGSILTIGGEKIRALVINRPHFDYLLSQAARDAGADIFISHKIISAMKQNQQISVVIQHNGDIKTVQCHLLIGADGSNSCIRDTFRFPKPMEILQGIGAELSGTILDPKFVHIFVGHAIAPGFFAWIIPTNPHGTTARIGLCIRKHSPYSLQHYFNILLKQPLLQQTTIMKRFGGMIPLGPLKKTIDDHILLVGDSAAQVKPTSGGGLYPGLLCANLCSLIAEEAVKTHTFTTSFLNRYQTQCAKKIGRELMLGFQFRKIFITLTDAQLNKILGKLNNKKIIHIINTYGDIDYPSRVALPLIKASPSLLFFAPAILKITKK